MQIARRAHRAEHSFRADDTVNEAWTTDFWSPLHVGLAVEVPTIEEIHRKDLTLAEVDLTARHPVLGMAANSPNHLQPPPHSD
ncbi:hypothetical protein U1Q18_044840 [Sarracenia purpurea var. burkii]